MRRPTVLLVASLSFPVAFACRTSGTGQPEVVEADTAGVMEAYSQRVSGLEEDDIERWLEVHAADVRFIDPNGPDIVGKDSLRAWAQPFFDGFTMKFNETVEEIHADRELAYIRYQTDGELVPKGGGETVGSHDKGLLILQLGDNGTWKITHNIWTSPVLPSSDE